MQSAQSPSPALRPNETFQGSTFIFKWKVKDFKTLEDQIYMSDTFWTNQRHPWKLAICPHGTKNSLTAVFLYLACNNADWSIYFQPKDTKIAISLQAGDYMRRKVGENKFFDKKNQAFGYAFAPRAQILEALGSANDTVVVTVEIQVPNPTPATVGLDPLASAIDKAFFNNKDTSDVVFHIDDKTFETHSAFLSARSTYFKALFGSDMKETHTLDAEGKMVVHVTDFDYDVFLTVMQYLHTNWLNFRHLPPCTPEVLFMAADKYNVKGLKEAMIDSLIDGLTVDNVVSVLFLDDLHSFTGLRRAALNFVRGHYGELKNSGALRMLKWNNSIYKNFVELLEDGEHAKMAAK